MRICAKAQEHSYADKTGRIIPVLVEKMKRSGRIELLVQEYLSIFSEFVEHIFETSGSK